MRGTGWRSCLSVGAITKSALESVSAQGECGIAWSTGLGPRVTHLPPPAATATLQLLQLPTLSILPSAQASKFQGQPLPIGSVGRGGRFAPYPQGRGGNTQVRAALLPGQVGRPCRRGAGGEHSAAAPLERLVTGKQVSAWKCGSDEHAITAWGAMRLAPRESETCFHTSGDADAPRLHMHRVMLPSQWQTTPLPRLQLLR